MIIIMSVRRILCLDKQGQRSVLQGLKLSVFLSLSLVGSFIKWEC